MDVFAGGGSIGLLAAAENLANEVVMVELDPGVSAVWQAILGDQGEDLATTILDFNLTLENVQAELAKEDTSTLELAFRTILNNRVSRGGILAPGAGLIRAGEANKGLLAAVTPLRHSDQQ